MGVVDKNTYNLTCACGNAETLQLMQQGSAYGATWQRGKAMDAFVVTWGNVGIGGPEMSNAVCNVCGRTAQIRVS